MKDKVHSMLAIILKLAKGMNPMGRDGVEPPESEDSRFTVCPATTYGISSLSWASWIRTNVIQESKSCALPLGDSPIHKR